MEENKTIAKILEGKYFKVPEVKDLRELLYKSAESFSKKIAFEVKDTSDKIYGITYEKFKNDVVSFGTGLVELRFI
jgi:hypothetical protein